MDTVYSTPKGETYLALMPTKIKAMVDEERIKIEPNNKMTEFLFKQIYEDGIRSEDILKTLTDWSSKNKIQMTSTYIKLPMATYEGHWYNPSHYKVELGKLSIIDDQTLADLTKIYLMGEHNFPPVINKKFEKFGCKLRIVETFKKKTIVSVDKIY